MTKTITVYYIDTGLYVAEEIAKRFNIKNGYRIKSEKEFSEIFVANAKWLLADSRSKLKTDG